MVEIVSACSCASASTSLPSGASIVSISSMFISMAPIRILRAKIVSLGAGWSCAAAASTSPAIASAAKAAANAPLHRKCNRITAGLFETGLFLVADIGGEHFAGRKHREVSHEPALFVGVAQRMEPDLDLIARLDHIAAPAADPHQISRAGRFHQPLGGRLVRGDRAV